jgi:NAD(P)-dependent dehydrogenase (short-subunit alcohol dehydrogenase family)
VILDGQRVLVTGAASGIGAATALTAARWGARVFGVDRVQAPWSSSTNGPGSLTFEHCDVSNEASVRAAFSAGVAALGGLDSVIHCAAVMKGQGQSIEEVELGLWQEVLTVNLTGTFLIAREAARVLLTQGGGTLLLVASRAGITQPSGSMAYGASKGGVHGLAMSLGASLGPRGVRVHAVMPGDIDTGLMAESLREALDNGRDPTEIDAIREHLQPPEAVAQALALLVSPQAGTLSGTLATQ